MVLVFPGKVGVMVTAVGLADSVKLGPAATVRETVVVAVELPEVPVIVMTVVPTAADPVAVSDRTLVDVVGFVPKVAVTPVGTFEAARVTAPVNPFKSVTVIVLVPAAPPCEIDTDVGRAARVNPVCKLAFHATARLSASTEPRPVTRL